MATSANSTQVTNARATPVVKADPEVFGRLYSKCGVIAPAAGETSTNFFRTLVVPSNACIRSVKLTCADATSAGKIDVGIYQTPANGGLSVDSDFLTDAFVLTDGPYFAAEIMNDLAPYTPAKRVQPLWQALGLTSDPHRDYDVVVLVDTTFNGGPTSMMIEVLYTV